MFDDLAHGRSVIAAGNSSTIVAAPGTAHLFEGSFGALEEELSCRVFDLGTV